MLGWHLSVYRLADDSASPATADSAQGTRLAVWQTGLGGLNWIEELVKAGDMIDLGTNGYPRKYTGIAERVIPYIVEKPPGARNTWLSGTDDVLTSQWEGTTVIDRAAVRACQPDEWLLIVAWDES